MTTPISSITTAQFSGDKLKNDPKKGDSTAERMVDYPKVLLDIIDDYLPKISKKIPTSYELTDFHPCIESPVAKTVTTATTAASAEEEDKMNKTKIRTDLIHDLVLQKSLILKERPDFKVWVETMTEENRPLKEQVFRLRRGLYLTENPEYGPAVAAWQRQHVSLEQQVLRLNLLRTYAFGNDKWNKHVGPIQGHVPLLPENIFEILYSPDPEMSDKNIMDTHVLVLMPKEVTIDGKCTEISFSTLEDIAQKPKNSKYNTQYASYYPSDDGPKCAIGEFKNKVVDLSHWILMRKEVLLGSGFKYYNGHKAMVEKEYSEKAGAAHFLPEALDVVACCFLTYISTGVRLFDTVTTKTWIYTRCQEQMEGINSWSLIVGSFGARGLLVMIVKDKTRTAAVCVAPARKFF